jgi:hypothetical protein
MSSVPAVKAALVTLLTAALPNTQVIYGPGTAVTTTTGRILTVGKVTNGLRDLDSMAIGTTEERYTVALAFSVDLPGAGTLATAVTQVFADYTAAELAIREYAGGPDLGLAAQGVLQALMFGGWNLDEQADSNGSHAAIDSSVAVIAQNT